MLSVPHLTNMSTENFDRNKASHKYKPSLQHTINLRNMRMARFHLATLREDLADIQEAEREIDVYAVMVHVEALEDILQVQRILHVLLINSASCFEI